ncbi:MAG: hypothetical protein KC656_01160 [Myxococcales bacterium]|nr:hypothetical protein [Myxococcales bacterium]
MELAEDLLMAQDIPGMLASFNPVYQGSYDVAGFELGSISASIGSVDFFRPIIIADPKPGVLEVTASIPYFEVQVDASGSAVGLDFDEDVWAGADLVDVSIAVQLDVDGNGDLQVTAYNPQIHLVGFWFDVSLVPDAIEGFLQQKVREVIETKVVEVLDDVLPDLLADRFAGLDIAFSTEVLGKGLTLEGYLADVQIDEVGIELHTDIRIDVERSIDTGNAGYLSVPSVVADPSMLDDLALTVSDNLLNNILFQTWRAGLLQLDLDSARGDIDATLLTPLGARGAARVQVNAAVPPVMIERNNSAMVQVTELLVHIETPGGEKGEFLDLAVTAYVDLDLVVENGVLKLSLNQPEVLVDVRDSDWGLADNTLTNLLAEQLPIDTLLLLLGQIELPLPSVAGISITDAVAFRDASGVHTSIGANL